jgi:hypothetical protein
MVRQRQACVATATKKVCVLHTIARMKDLRHCKGHPHDADRLTATRALADNPINRAYAQDVVMSNINNIRIR